MAAIEDGFPQREIAESSYRFQQELEAKVRTIVGVNQYVEGDRGSIETLSIDETAAAVQLERLASLKARRHGPDVAVALGRLRECHLRRANES